MEYMKIKKINRTRYIYWKNRSRRTYLYYRRKDRKKYRYKKRRKKWQSHWIFKKSVYGIFYFEFKYGRI